MVNNLLAALVLFTKLYHKPFTMEALTDGLPFDKSNLDENFLISNEVSSLFSRAAQRAGIETALVKRELGDFIDLHLPAILVLRNQNVCILEQFSEDRRQVKVIYAEGEGLEEWLDVERLEEDYLGFGFLLKKSYSYDSQKSKNMQLKQKNWLWDTLKISKKLYSDVLWASLLINIFVLATPLFTMNVYDRVIPNKAQETLFVFTIGIVLVYLLDTFLKFTRTYLLELAAKKNDVVMSSIIYEKMMDIKMANIPASVGSFASNIKDFETIRSFFANATMTVLVDLPFTFIMLAVIYYIGGVIVLVPMSIMIVILLFALFIKNPLQKSIEESHKASAKKSAILIETLQNIESVKLLNMMGKRQWFLEEATGDIATTNLKSRMMSGAIPVITQFLMQLNTVLIVFVGVYLIYEFELTMGGLIALVILSSRTISPMGQVTALITNFEDAKTSYNVLNEIISQPSEHEIDKAFLNLPKFQGKIEFRNVTFAYPNSELKVLDNVSFVVNPGEKVAILGRIGSGKSTIMKLLVGLYEPVSGMILIDDIDIKQIDPCELRRRIGYIPQDIQLFSGTLKENIVSSEHNIDDGVFLEAAKLSGVQEFAKMHPSGYDMQIAERGMGLSGGQKQSVGIARAFLGHHALVLMDEPTNAMDQMSESNVIGSMKTVLKDSSVLLVTQRFSVLELCERVMVIDHGRLVLDGEKNSVLKQLKGDGNV